MSQQPTPEGVMQLGLGFWASKTLLSAVELGIFTELAKGPKTLPELMTCFGLHERSAQDFFDALVALHMLTREQGRYANTPDTDVFLDRNKPSYVGGMLDMCSRRLFGFWGSLTEALQTGKPQNEAKRGQDFFATLYSDPARLEGFLKAMTGISLGPAMAMAHKFPWSSYTSFVDVGTAQGGFAAQVALAHPHLSGVGMDLPQVETIFTAYVAEQKLQERLTFQARNFFTDPFPKADVVVMGHILHDWNLEEKRMLLTKAYEALPKGGAVVVYEALIDDERTKNAFGLLMSLNMLIETPGGFDFTGADCQGWMRKAGFQETRVEHLVGPDSMVIGIKS